MFNLSTIPSPILFRGDASIAYRDPTAIYQDGVFRIFFTLVSTEADGKIYLYTAMSKTRDLIAWDPIRILTPRDQSLNFSSPGNIIHQDGGWILCLQTYCRPNGEKYGNGDSRIWIMRSKDLDAWDYPELLYVKGKSIPFQAMGRMIDPYLIEDKDTPGLWWCFYKQNGMSISFSRDLMDWSFHGRTDAGENACVIVKDNRYILFHSPGNGIGVKTSTNLLEWKDQGSLITLGQKDWEWARGRITAGFVLDARHIQGIERYLMFFHGTGPEDEQTVFDTHACIGIAFSDDLLVWNWPGM